MTQLIDHSAQNSTYTIGWDVGGANLKAALLDQKGAVLAVFQLLCPLWRGLNQLKAALDHVLSQLPAGAYRHAVTMTGELVDLFANRHQGVLEISQTMRNHLQGDLRFYAGKQGFVLFEQIASHTAHIASANWLASAELMASSIKASGMKCALLIDIGSTTTDLIPLIDAKVTTQSTSDADRMQADELVYTGVIRTPLMALCQKIEWDGKQINIAAEHFATTADIYRLMRELMPEDDQADTADDAGKSMIETARRLARIVGRDVESASLADWKALAQAFSQVQLMQIKNAAERVIADNKMSRSAPLIGAGAGRFLVARLAKQMNRPYVEVNALLSDMVLPNMAAVCLPAYAVAKLALDGAC